MITINPKGKRWAYFMTCGIPGCLVQIQGIEDTVDEVHAVIEEQPWMRGLDLGEGYRNADLCPQHAANFKAGGAGALDRHLAKIIERTVAPMFLQLAQRVAAVPEPPPEPPPEPARDDEQE